MKTLHTLTWNDPNVQESLSSGIESTDGPIDALSDGQDENSTIGSFFQMIHDVFSIIRNIPSSVTL